MFKQLLKSINVEKKLSYCILLGKFKTNSEKCVLCVITLNAAFSSGKESNVAR